MLLSGIISFYSVADLSVKLLGFVLLVQEGTMALLSLLLIICYSSFRDMMYQIEQKE